jgi:hypothetical protein
MRTGAQVFSKTRAERRGAFWLWFVVKFTLGVFQMVGAIYVAYLMYRRGLGDETMKAFFIVASLTTLSMILFKVLGWKPFKR